MKSICNIENCDTAVYAKGMCLKHYTRARRHGDPSITHRLTGAIGLRERVETIGFDVAECWEWRGVVGTHGYGTIKFEGRVYRVHRLMWEWANDRQVPEGMVIMHSCDNRRCAKPEHLSAGTASDNMRDAHAKGRARNHGKYKTQPETVFLIRRLWRSGDFNSMAAIDRYLGLSSGTAFRVISGIAFAWLQEKPLASGEQLV